MNFLRALSNILRFDRTNWKALALCFFAAAVFWIFNALNKNYATHLRFPLHFEFNDTTNIAVQPLPASIILNVSGNGWELLRRRLGFKVPTINIPLDRPTDTHKIIAASLSPLVSSQLGALQVNYIVTDTLQVNIEPRVKRKVKLIAELNSVTFKKDLGRISAIVVLPDSVILEGPKSIIKDIRQPLLLRVNNVRLDNNFRENVEVDVPNKELISRNPPVAEVMFEVGPVIETEKFIKLKVARAPWGTEIDADSVRCLFIVPEKEVDNFSNDARKMYLTFDLIDMPRGQTMSYLPQVNGLPDYASLAHVDSIKVKKY